MYIFILKNAYFIVLVTAVTDIIVFKTLYSVTVNTVIQRDILF